MEWIGAHLWETWLGLAIALGVAEVFNLDLVLLMLAGGALVGTVTALLGVPVVLQALLAVATSVAMLALVRPSMVGRLHGGPDLRIGPAALVGRQGLVITEVTVHDGLIKLDGEEWTARPYDQMSTIAAGSTVDVLEIKGATALVHQAVTLDS